ncbi:stalk domain-containing protein [Anaeromicrobium sediminis]|uniref:Copper amine oxidase-like N-terminal domain-containing protein n=1 Tax=Anaeromicrobium sediminis TaxID=1478221 RepID=A0A267MKG6_9FIRM|nr:stalk domain-containing protein [Anaeromicrobium sediminis]PAB59375.1 hypothetical protein CCE28_10980 [Anaeromicrobium sediminis]
MKKILSMILGVSLLFSNVAFASSGNHIDRVPPVKVDYKFVNSNAPKLKIEEDTSNEFTSEEQRFTIRLNNAKWYDESIEMINKYATCNISGSKIKIDKKGSTSARVTITRSSNNTDKKAVFTIPLFVEITDPGNVTVTIQSSSLVSPGEYTFAKAIDTKSNLKKDLPHVYPGFEFSKDDATFIRISESSNNEFTKNQKFRLKLDNGTWNYSEVIKNIKASDNNIKVISIDNIDENTLEFNIIKDSSNKVSFIDIPIISTVLEKGDAKVTIIPVKSSMTKNTYYYAFMDKVAPVKPKIEINLFMNKKDVSIENPDGKNTIQLNVAPYNLTGTTMIPVTGIIDNLDANVKWNGETRQITITDGNNTFIILTLDSNYALVNGEKIELSQAPMIINGRTLIPLRFVSENLGCEVKWYEDEEKITILKMK